MHGYIYKITCKKNKKSYIGQTREFGIRGKAKYHVKIGIEGRWKQHVWNAKNHNDDCPALNRALRKYGEENFTVVQLCKCPLEELNEKEKYFIKEYNTYIGYGYNCTVGGDFPLMEGKHKIEVYKRLSDIAKERWKNEEFRERVSTKIRNTMKTKMWEEDVRTKMLDSLKPLRKAKNLPSNIYERKVDGKVVGYEVKIQINKKLHRDWFCSTKNSPDINLKNAIECLDEIKRNNLSERS